MTRILQVFWFNRDTWGIGLLLTDPNGSWATETTVNEAWEHRWWIDGSEEPPRNKDAYLKDLRGLAQVFIEGGKVSYAT